MTTHMQYPRIILIFIIGFLCRTKLNSENKMENATQASVYDFTVKNIDGKEVSLREYSGKVLLIVNTASRCGFTPQYKGLEELYQKYKSQGFAVLGFPSNDFGGQEPGTNAEIKSFCDLSFKVTFPLFEKGPVTGDAIQPLYKFLTETANPKFDGKVRWNFEKFVMDRQGRLIERYRSITTPQSGRLARVIEQALSEGVK